MKHAPSWFCTGLEFCGVAVVVAACLPLFALLLFVFRAVALAAALGAVAVIAVLYGLAPRFRSWFNALVEMAEWRRAVAHPATGRRG